VCYAGPATPSRAALGQCPCRHLSTTPTWPPSGAASWWLTQTVTWVGPDLHTMSCLVSSTSNQLLDIPSQMAWLLTVVQYLSHHLSTMPTWRRPAGKHGQHPGCASFLAVPWLLSCVCTVVHAQCATCHDSHTWAFPCRHLSTTPACQPSGGASWWLTGQQLG